MQAMRPLKHRTHAGNELNSMPIVDESSTISHQSHNARGRKILTSDAIQLCIAALGLILLSPMFIMLAILIKLTSPGPIFYRGLRVGKERRVFNIYKFRTLQVGAEEKIGARLLNEQDFFYTKIGKFLKRTKLDELPQLFNILKGEMNLVGPRPIRPIFLDSLAKEIPLYDLRFAVKPGMTGLAQIKGGYFTDPKDKLRYELIYIRNRSAMLDLKLIFLTVLKLLNHYFTLGFLCLMLFFFTSFMYESSIPSIYIYILQIRINLLHLLTVAGGGWLLTKRIPKGKLHIYHTPLNLPMIAFFLFTTATSYFALQPFSALRGSLYYPITGFLIVFLLINGHTTQQFVANIRRTIAIIAVSVSSVGLFEIFLTHHSAIALAEGNFPQPNLELPRISSTLGNPLSLSTYLILGFPLLLCELTYAERKPVRDFWLISATIVFMSVILTQTRIGLLSLAITVSIFFYKDSRRKFIIFILSFCILFFVIVSIGGPRYSPSKIWLEWKEALISSFAYLSEIPLERLLIGIGSKGAKKLTSLEISMITGLAENDRVLPSNMHLVLIIENGVVGWAIMMWILIAALRSLWLGYKKIKDPRLQMTVWAIFSSISGFAVSMNSLASFFNISIQTLFWGLLGIGLAVVVRFSAKRSGFIRVWKFGD
jgi:lipopolysaccharide/colanic/teichoic acid biosynthesis glycosyltransferase